MSKTVSTDTARPGQIGHTDLSSNKHTMNTKTALQAARNVMTGKHLGLADVTRSTLKAAAVSNGRTFEQASKASTMRLAMWASVGKSAI